MKRLVFLALFCSACASLPVKQKATTSIQASEAALESAHNIERGLCFVSPATETGNHCTNATATTVGLTDTTHVELAVLFSHAFDVEAKAAAALIIWRSDDPIPTSVKEYQQDLSDILTLVRQTMPTTSNLIQKVQVAVDEGSKIAAIIGIR